MLMHLNPSLLYNTYNIGRGYLLPWENLREIFVSEKWGIVEGMCWGRDNFTQFEDCFLKDLWL